MSTIPDALASHLGDNSASTPTPKVGVMNGRILEAMALEQEMEDRVCY